MKMEDKSMGTDVVAATMIAGGGVGESAGARGEYKVECFDADGNLKWSDTFPNRVVNTGLQYMNTQTFTGSAYTAAWYLGLILGPGSGVTVAATDTMASHPGWTESSAYSQVTRPQAVFGSATLADPSAIATTATSFSINATVNIAGAFLTTNNTKGGTAGVLFSASNFTGGDRLLQSGDTLNVTYTFTLDAP